ncbi:hypothetical protein KUF71_024992 [Frankliniella fusca]|uniref:Uncharacterized protein n=1 Tax=Frankliniella fusca TaxID=407009 RepID=A0AAE1I2C5_9NEOP|nr:hypothetical protein KUF71_024992 [Frankliniella fusca]
MCQAMSSNKKALPEDRNESIVPFERPFPNFLQSRSLGKSRLPTASQVISFFRMSLKKRPQCFDPFRSHKHIVRNDLRYVREVDVELFPHLGIEMGFQWCANCRKRAAAEHNQLFHPKEVQSSVCDNHEASSSNCDTMPLDDIVPIEDTDRIDPSPDLFAEDPKDKVSMELFGPDVELSQKITSSLTIFENDLEVDTQNFSNERGEIIFNCEGAPINANTASEKCSFYVEGNYFTWKMVVNGPPDGEAGGGGIFDNVIANGQGNQQSPAQFYTVHVGGSSRDLGEAQKL